MSRDQTRDRTRVYRRQEIQSFKVGLLVLPQADYLFCKAFFVLVRVLILFFKRWRIVEQTMSH